MKLNLEGNKERFEGFSELYNLARPSPPSSLIDIAKQVGRFNSNFKVVDLGCGTGLSTFFWAEAAKEVIGIDPSEDMLAVANSNSANFSNVRFTQGFSHAIPLEDQSTDLVCCSQSLHWMEPASTLSEINRILKKGGLFIAYDCLWPPTLNWEAEQIWNKFFFELRKLEKSLNVFEMVHYWPKDQHLIRIKESGHFRYLKEITFEKQEEGNAERFIQLAMSQGQVQTILKLGCSEEEAGLSWFKKEIKKVLSDTMIPWWFSYKVRMAVK